MENAQKKARKILVAQAIRNAIRANRFARIIRNETPIFIARQADSHESLEFPIRANHPIRANRANRFARITPLRGKSQNEKSKENEKSKDWSVRVDK